MSICPVELGDTLATITLDDPGRRNALGLAMFDGLDRALGELAAAGGAHVVLLSGSGQVFCAGFDLAAAAADPTIMAVFIERLSAVLRAIRALPQVVVAAVQGAAIAGGCALVSACDLAVVSATAKLGYPVHGLGVSPAVSIPTLAQAIGPGPARALLLEGRLIDGREACRIGLAAHVSNDDDGVGTQAIALCPAIAAGGPDALRATKAWLNELDGSLEAHRYRGPAADSARLAATPEARRLLAAALRGRQGS